ncbi:MAG TPA: HEAT repeat domain-containing protein, partial [Anaerolineae bacterium]|nr:HEAT repeat domain-containing protein [Anaerolineae bacterium]
SVRQAAAQALGSVVSNNEEVRAGLLARLTDENGSVRQAAAQALGSVVSSDEEVRAGLLARLTDNDSDVMQAAAQELGSVVSSDEEVRAGLLARLTDENWRTRIVCIGLLIQEWDDFEQFTHYSKTIQAYLIAEMISLELIYSHDRPFIKNIRDSQMTIAQRLGKSLVDDTNVQQMVVNWLASSAMGQRFGGIYVVTQSYMEKIPPELVQKAIEATNDIRSLASYPARLVAAELLLNDSNSQYSQDAINVCLEALQYGTGWADFVHDSSQIRQKAALILGKLEPLNYNQAIYDALLPIMKNDENRQVRDAVYQTLVRLSQLAEENKGKIEAA